VLAFLDPIFVRNSDAMQHTITWLNQSDSIFLNSWQLSAKNRM